MSIWVLPISKMSVSSKNETSTGEKAIEHSIWIDEYMILVPISAKYHKWKIHDLHQKWKEIKTRWKQNTILWTSIQDPPHSKHSNNVYIPLTIDSPDIKGGKNNDLINKQSKHFDELRGNRITIMDPPTKEEVEKFWNPLYEKKSEYNKDASWLQEYKTSVINIMEATYIEITKNEIESATSEFSNCKSP